MATPEIRAALSAYWNARNRDEERIANQRMMALGLPDAYAYEPSDKPGTVTPINVLEGPHWLTLALLGFSVGWLACALTIYYVYGGPML